MTARDDLDTGIAALGLLGGTENLPAAREAFRQAAELDPGMCDAWMGLAAAGDISTEILRCAHHTSTTLHRETRRLGLRDNPVAVGLPSSPQ